MISVIVPAYNAENTIEKCIYSVLGGTIGDIEVIVVDDGSRDGTAAAAAAAAAKDSRVRLIQKENGGVSSARNCGLDEARGELVMFLDSDDVMDPQICEKLLKNMEENTSDAAMCGYSEISKKGTVRHLSPALPLLGGGEEIFRGFIGPVMFSGTNGFMASVWTTLFKRCIIEENGLRFDERIRIAEDALFLTRYLLCCESLSTVNEALYDYMLADGSATKKYTDDLEYNNTCLEEALRQSLLSAGIGYTPEMEAKRAVSCVFSLLVNEARTGSPGGFFRQAGRAASACKKYRDVIRAYRGGSRHYKIKKIIAGSPFLSVCFFTVRRVQRALGVYF